MKRALGLVVITLLARPGASSPPSLDMTQEHALTMIDREPTTPELDVIFKGNARTTLVGIVQDTTSTDPQHFGVRLRAIHALVNYPDVSPDTTTQDALTPLLVPDAASGQDILLLRATLEALGQLHVTGKTQQIAAFLDHNSRDVRAAAALALRDLGDSTAVCALRTRLQHEAIPQVRLAISAALRVLGQTSCP